MVMGVSVLLLVQCVAEEKLLIKISPLKDWIHSLPYDIKAFKLVPEKCALL